MAEAKQVSANSEVMPPRDDAPVEPDVPMDSGAGTAAAAAAPAEIPVEVPPPAKNSPPMAGTFTMSGPDFHVHDAAGVARPYVGPTVDFISRDPGLMLELGDVTIRFALGRTSVPAPIADRMKRHMLYANNKFYLADEVAVVGGEIVSYRENKAFQDQMAAMKKGEVAMYATKSTPTLVMEFGDVQVRFQDGYAVVPLDMVERFERHVFVREQRVTRLAGV